MQGLEFNLQHPPLQQKILDKMFSLMGCRDKEACVVTLLAGPLQNNFLEGGCIGLNGLHLVMLFGEVGGGGAALLEE